MNILRTNNNKLFIQLADYLNSVSLGECTRDLLRRTIRERTRGDTSQTDRQIGIKKERERARIKHDRDQLKAQERSQDIK